jgi:hypothetical protein
VFEVNRWLPVVIGSQRQLVTYASRQRTLAVIQRTPAGVGDIATRQFITGVKCFLRSSPTFRVRIADSSYFRNDVNMCRLCSGNVAATPRV